MPHALLSVPRSSHCLTRPALHIAWLSSISARSSPEFGAIHSVFTTRKANQRKDCKSRSQWANKQGISNKAQEQGSINAKLEQLRAAGSYCDYGRVKTLAKELVVNRGYKPGASIYEALILANANPDRGSVQEISRWLQDMEKADVAPDSATYHAALKALAVHPDQLLRDDILQTMRDRWYDISNDGYHYVAAGLIRERKLELAIDWLQRMREAGIGIESWLYDLLIYSLCDVGELDEALSTIKYRLKYEGRDTLPTHGDYDSREFVSPNVWYHFLDCASRARHIEGTIFAYNARVKTRYLNPAGGICQNILICAAQAGDIKLATAIFDLLTQRSANSIQLQHFETLIEAYVNSGDVKTAITLLATAQQSGHLPKKASTRPILAALGSSQEKAERALEWLEELRDLNRGIPLAAFNVVIESFVHLEDMEGAMLTYNTFSTSIVPDFPSSPVPRRGADTETFNLFLEGCVVVRDKIRAEFLASEMLALKVVPDAMTYDALVRVCMACESDMSEAWRYISEAQESDLNVRDSTVRQLAVMSARRSQIAPNTADSKEDTLEQITN